MKKILFLLIFFPLLAFSQVAGDSIMYRGVKVDSIMQFGVRADSIVYRGVVFKSKTVVVSTPNEYTGTDAVGDDSNAVGDWLHQSGLTVTSVTSNDLALGDSYALEFKTTVANAYKQGYIDLAGLPQVPLTATIRTRRLAGSGFISNWDNVTSATYNTSDATYTTNGTAWFESTVIFTPTTGNVRIKVYTSGDTGAVGSTIEISSIITTIN